MDINMVDVDGWTALMHAAHYNHAGVVETLLAAPGVDVNKKVTGGTWSKGKTALGLAMYRNKVEVAALLRAAGGRAGWIF